MSDNCGIYTAPDPTPEQIANAKEKDFDPKDRLGSGVTDLSATDVLAAAATIHDVIFTVGGSSEIQDLADKAFERDCWILALAVEDAADRAFESAKAKAFSDIVYLLSDEYWQEEDRNNAVTEAQDHAFAVIAMKYINCKWIYLQTECQYRLNSWLLALIGEGEPYPTANL